MDSVFYRAQQSEDLRALFEELAGETWRPRGVGSATERTSVPKYRLSTMRRLAERIVFQTYSRHTEPLCLMAAAADDAARGRGWAGFLWGEAVDDARACRRYFRAALPDASAAGAPDGVVAEDAGLSLGKGAGSLRIDYGFMPGLCVLLDFSTRAIGFPAVEEALAPLTERPRTVAAVREASNRLSRALYQWLEPHLTSKRRQDNFKTIAEFLTAHLGEGFRARDVDDETVWALWLTRSGDAGYGLPKKYGTVFTDVLRFLDLMDHSASLAALERSLSFETEAARLDHMSRSPSLDLSDTQGPVGVGALLGDIAEAEGAAGEAGGAYVALFNREIEARVEFLIDWRWLLPGLPCSFLRHEAFGSVAKVGGGSWNRLFETNQYQHSRAELIRTLGVLDEALSAGYDVRKSENGAEVSEQETAFDAARGEAVVQLSSVRTAGRQFLARGGSALKQVLDGVPEAIAAFLDAVDRLPRAKDALSATLDSLPEGAVDAPVYERDRAQFAERLGELRKDNA